MIKTIIHVAKLQNGVTCLLINTITIIPIILIIFHNKYKVHVVTIKFILVNETLFKWSVLSKACK